jgi:hypothetical protein
MPGMMSTIHNLGANEEMVEEFANHPQGNILAWDNFRRFLQSWGMANGMEREDFQELMDAAKERGESATNGTFPRPRCASWPWITSGMSGSGASAFPTTPGCS